MTLGFGSGPRFLEAKEVTPGPGQYDPKKDVGFKADPRSGFLTGERFGSEDLSEGGEEGPL